MKKKKRDSRPQELNKSERGELVRLRARTAYLEAENEVIKRDRLERAKMERATQGEKAKIVQELRKEGYPLKYLRRAMQPSRSAYYFELSKQDAVIERNTELNTAIREIFEQLQERYGVRRIYHELCNRSHCVNHRRIQRILHFLVFWERDQGESIFTKGTVTTTVSWRYSLAGSRRRYLWS